MEEIGVRELRQRLSEILRRVRENSKGFGITYRGKAVARLIPSGDSSGSRDETSVVWAEMDELTREMAEVWPSDVSAT